MMLLNSADHVYVGSTPVDAVYLGTTKVWPQATLPPQGLTAVLEAGGVLRIDGQFIQGDHTLTITDPNGVGATLADTQTMSVTGSIIPADAASGMVLLSPNHWSNYKTHIGTPLHAVGHRQVLGTMVMYTESVTTT
jgi:hypothetical protein